MKNIIESSASTLQPNKLIEIISYRLKSLKLEDCQRLFHGRGRSYAGANHFNIEKYGQWIAIVFYENLDERLWIDVLLPIVKKFDHYFAIQRRWMPQSPWEFLDQRPPNPYVVFENGVKYHLDFSNQNPGLFLDMRLGREWIGQNARNKRVANLFAYTCAFSVVAAQVGAAETINLDMSQSALKRGKKNLQLNQMDVQTNTIHRFLSHDILKSLGKITKLGPYDIVIIDPPTRQKSFDPLSNYDRILRRAAEWVQPCGMLMLTLNDPSTPYPEFKSRVDQIIAGDFLFECRLDNPPEIEELEPDKGLKVLLYSRNESN